MLLASALLSVSVVCVEIKPGQTGLEEQQKYLVDSAAVFRMYALEAERQSLEKQLENVLRQCALVARKPTRGKRAVRVTSC